MECAAPLIWRRPGVGKAALRTFQLLQGSVMIEGRIIVSVANSWDYDPTSKHQIMKILSRRNDIVWINYHGTRRPTLDKADFTAACSTLRRVARGIQRVSPSIVQVTPLVIPGVTGRLPRHVHRRLLTAQIRRAIRSVAGADRRPVQSASYITASTSTASSTGSTRMPS